MSAATLLDQARDAGITLRLVGDQLKVKGLLVILDAWAPRLHPHKDELHDLLRQEAANEVQPARSSDSRAVHEAFEERAAILEFEGGLARADAEAQATRELQEEAERKSRSRTSGDGGAP